MRLKTQPKFGVSGTGKKGKANPIDKHVGEQVRKLRSIAGVSQNDLAEKIGVTFQQLQKYENGSNRISASRLHDLAKALNTPVTAFFDDYKDSANNMHSLKDGRAISASNADRSDAKETIALLSVFYSIENPVLRRNLLAFTKELARSLQKDAPKDKRSVNK